MKSTYSFRKTNIKMINKRAIRNEFCEVDVKHSKSSERSTNKDDLMHLFWINKNKKVKLESLNILCIGIKADNHYTLCSIFVRQEKKWRRSLTIMTDRNLKYLTIYALIRFCQQMIVIFLYFPKKDTMSPNKYCSISQSDLGFFFQRVRISK